MAELRAMSPAVTIVLASSEGCDAAGADAADTVSCRVSPVEVMLVGPIDEKALRDAVKAVDRDAVVQDVSDGWAGFALEGAEARAAFERLSELELPERGCVQGEVARLPVKVFAEPERLLLLVSATVADHLERRIREDCAEMLR